MLKTPINHFSPGTSVSHSFHPTANTPNTCAEYFQDIEMQEISKNKSGPIKIGSILESASKVMALIAAAVLFIMMLVTVGDVIGRYFFRTPIKGTWEIVGLSLIFAATWGFAYCQLKKQHINVTIILERFPPRVRAVLTVTSLVFGLVGFSIICWRMILQAQKYFLMTRGNTTDTLNLPYAPFMLGLAIGAGFMALMLVYDIVRVISAEVKRK
jgi:TRAP-type transport system small permease protein